jgi:hypothetical protein
MNGPIVHRYNQITNLGLASISAFVVGTNRVAMLYGPTFYHVDHILTDIR